MSAQRAGPASETSTLSRVAGGSGITLVEVVVALLLLAIGAMALAAGIGAGQKARREALSRGLALAAAEGWLEEWRAQALPALPAGAQRTGEGEVLWGRWRGWLRWRVTSLAPCLVEGRVEAGPMGRAASVVLVTRRFREGAPAC